MRHVEQRTSSSATNAGSDAKSDPAFDAESDAVEAVDDPFVVAVVVVATIASRMVRGRGW